MVASATRTASRALLRSATRRTLSTSSTVASSSSSSSSGNTTTWQPLLKPGVLPAYDEALSFLSSHSASVQSQISTIDKDHPTLSNAEKSALKESLEIAAAINDPSLLSTFQSSNPTTYDASNPAFRHLRERLWRKDSGVLAKVIERCTLMHVFPDVLPGITPTVDVQVSFGQGDGFTDHMSQGGDVLVGVFVEAKQTTSAPKVDVNVFHTEEKKYSLVIVDPDQPDQDLESFKTSLLALKTDIPLSATSSPTIDLTQNMSVDYIPPHPQQGTPYHRYTTILLEQSNSNTISTHELDANNFNLSNFIQQNQLVPAGIHFWRAKWTPESADSISQIYTNTLKLAEPKYTHPPTLDKIRKQVGDIGSKWF
ncbi:related to MRPL35 - mitochondrial ribosomal protein, large subunit [Ustilago trichophora]|uniref:Related to MRPL35 - mitochondrial ribosomal protein, large subunit n=1 Tax=Ustilago trichophora TaxID=86804 RepID=A0A5C3E8U6_9BASI|nr:related to MRPL35 - mitochondrial ribosomal protein, large subunit [Ustilago trichophora]